MPPQHPVFEPKSGVDPELCIFSMTFFAMIREGRGGLRERRRFRGHEEITNPYGQPPEGRRTGTSDRPPAERGCDTGRACAWWQAQGLSRPFSVERAGALVNRVESRDSV